jgi:hypothetical protein
MAGFDGDGTFMAGFDGDGTLLVGDDMMETFPWLRRQRFRTNYTACNSID